MLPISHAPTTYQSPCLRVHRNSLALMGSVFGPAWQAENDCLSVKHPIVASKLQALQQSHAEATAAVEQAVVAGPCCDECAKTNAEWAKFEAERPDRLDLLDRELQAERDAADLLVMGNIEGTPKDEDEPAPPLYWKFTPDVDEAPRPWACGGGENPLTLAIGASNFKSTSVERRPA